MTNKIIWNRIIYFGIMGIISVYLTSASCAYAETAVSKENESIKTITARSKTDAVLERLSDGASNLVWAPVEVIYQTRKEIKRADPLSGLIPGVAKGIGWMGTRFGVGIYEILTCYMPWEPHLKKFDTDWVYA